MRIELYTKPDCLLCDEGQALVQQACRKWGLEWVETSIFASQALFDLYRYEVPVLCVDGRKVATLRLDREQVERALSGGLDTVR